MNKWTLLLILIVLAAAGILNRDKISAYFGNKPPVEAPPPVVVAATPNPAKESIEMARRRYPQLAVANSPFNVHFVDLYNTAKTSDPTMLTQADWPMKLADRTAHDLTAAVTPQPSIDSLKGALDGRPVGQVGSTVVPTVQLPGLKGSALDQRPPAGHH